MLDGREQLTPQDNPNSPPFLNSEQRKQFVNSFSWDSFRIAVPSKGDPYLVVTLPDAIQPLNEIIRFGAAKAALQMSQLGKGFSELDLSDEELIRIRQDISKYSDEVLKSFNRSFWMLAMGQLMYEGFSHALIEELKQVALLPDGSEKDLKLKEFEDRERQFGHFIFGTSASPNDSESTSPKRYIVYCGNKEIYKTPDDLEDLDLASRATRQN